MRTFIFGAGASVHAGYPLANEMGYFLTRWARENFPESHIFRAVVDKLDAEFDVSRSFELVLTDLDDQIELMSTERPITREGNFEKHLLLKLRQTLGSMIPMYFNSLRFQAAELYEIFAADILAPGDAVITFNYDLALDRALKKFGKWSIGDGYGFEVDVVSFGESPCKLFKLHGSTNWRGEFFRGNLGFFQMDSADMSLGQRPIIDPSEFAYLGYSDGRDPQCHDGRVRIESLIMPSAKKRFFHETSVGREWEAFWDSLWYQAGESLSISEDVYVIGYSIPEYDTRARELLATRIDACAKVKVCCHGGTLSVIESLKQIVEQRNIFVERADATTFEEWVSTGRPR